MLNEIALGLGMMALTTMIHAMFMASGMEAAGWRLSRFGRARRQLARAALVSTLTAWMFLAIAIEAWVWALLYLYHPLITTLPDLETAYYFSMVTFTTLGYGDVVLIGNWRTLASIQAANGVIVFGWTTALIFVFIQRVYSKE
jgi:voltage-gated potassium channel Kch